MKLQIWELKRYYTIKAANNKGADQTALVTYGINRFSHDKAHLKFQPVLMCETLSMASGRP